MVLFAICKSHWKTAKRFHWVSEHMGLAMQNNSPALLCLLVQLFRPTFTLITSRKLWDFWPADIFCRMN